MQNKSNGNRHPNETRRKVFTGVVTSDKMDKTIVVQVMRQTIHPRYKKTVKKFSSFKAHDEKNAAKIGDVVKIEETRPISKDKRWRLIEIMK